MTGGAEKISTRDLPSITYLFGAHRDLSRIGKRFAETKKGDAIDIRLVNRMSSVVLHDAEDIVVIVDRLRRPNATSIELNLDVRCLHVFLRILADDFIYAVGLFFPEIADEWKGGLARAGKSLKSISSEGLEPVSEFKKRRLAPIEALAKSLDFRNTAVHLRERSSTWTIRWKGETADPYTSVSLHIADAPESERHRTLIAQSPDTVVADVALFLKLTLEDLETVLFPGS